MPKEKAGDKDKNNGKKAGDATLTFSLEQIKEMEEVAHSPDSTEKAFSLSDAVNAIRMIILQDEGLIANSMRYNLPSRSYAVASAVLYSKNKAHNDKEGNDELQLLLGLYCSVGEQRINKLIEAVIGERKWQTQGQGFSGLADKIKNFAGVGP